MSRTKPGEALSFLEAAISSETDECVLWPFAKVSGGYGLIRIDGQSQLASRIVCERVHGPAPSPECHAAHEPMVCHNRACVNPRHLRWASPSENRGDQHSDGTITEAGTRVLSKTQVVEIFRAEGLQREIAERFGISQSQVSRIKNGEHIYSKKLFAVRQQLRNDFPSISQAVIVHTVARAWREFFGEEQLYDEAISLMLEYLEECTEAEA